METERFFRNRVRRGEGLPNRAEPPRRRRLWPASTTISEVDLAVFSIKWTVWMELGCQGWMRKGIDSSPVRRMGTQIAAEAGAGCGRWRDQGGWHKRQPVQNNLFFLICQHESTRCHHRGWLRHPTRYRSCKGLEELDGGEVRHRPNLSVRRRSVPRTDCGGG